MNTKQTNIMIVKRLIHFMHALLVKVVIAVIFAVAGFLTSILIPTMLVDISFEVLQGKGVTWLELAILILLGLLRGMFRYGEHYYGHYVAFRVLANYRRAIFSKLCHLAPAKLDRQDSGKLLKMIGEDVEALEVFFAHTLAPLTTAVIITLLLMPYYCIVNWSLALVALGTYSMIGGILPILFAKKLKPLLTKQQQQRKKYMADFLESLTGMKDLLQFFAVEKRFGQLEKESKQVNDYEKQVAQVQYTQMANSFFSIGIGMFLFAVISFTLVKRGSLTLYQAIKALVVFSSSFAPYLELSRLPLGFKRSILAAEHVFSLLDEEEVEKSGQALQASVIHEIDVQNVHFSYPHRQQEILSAVNLHIDQPKMIGIVGESGSGKSTLMKLLLGWYQPTSGDIFYQEQTNVAMDDIQKHFAYIPQHPQLFQQTIRENLTFGNPKISDEQILAVADKCHMKELILKTAKGLDTVLSSEQAIFSSGELQRLELTRALLKEADVYIFDEPTSHLDSLNEASLLQVIKAECQGIVFIISHRPSTVACADEIYQMTAGKLILVQEKGV